MKIKALITDFGAFIPCFMRSREIVIKKPIFFLIDTGATRSVVNAIEFDSNFSCNTLSKGEKAVGIGGIRQCYLIHDVTLFCTSEALDKIHMLKKFEKLDVLPITHDNKGKPLHIHSLLGRDVIGMDYKLFFSKNEVFLEKE